MSPHRRSPARVTAVMFLLVAPVATRALTLLDEGLRAPDLSTHVLALEPATLVALATAPEDGATPAPADEATRAPAPGSMDFDLLGDAQPPPETPDAGAMRTRRRMLTAHQAIGFGLVGLQLATTVVGQLNYNDRFGDANTARYRDSHKALAYTTLGVFAVNGIVALLAPRPVKTPRTMDRVMIHRIALFTAAAGMAGQAALGIYTAQREGYLDKPDYGKAHLALGYVTLAAIATGVGALVF